MLALRIARARAATATSPSEAQKAAGNYAKGKVRLHGLTVSIENPKGSVRRGVDAKGRAWESRLACDYGYLNRTEGADGDAVDVFLGPHLESEVVFIVDQVNQAGEFDEHKVVIGARSEAEARALYLANYSAGWKVGPITALTMGQFKRWLDAGNTTRPIEGRALLVLKAREIKGKPGNVLGVDRRGRAHWRRLMRGGAPTERVAKPWPLDFPLVQPHSTLPKLYRSGRAGEALEDGKSAAYLRAKGHGDIAAATEVVRGVFRRDLALLMGEQYRGARVLSVHADTGGGLSRNRIPMVFAAHLAAVGGLHLDTDVRQATRAGHTKATPLQRFARQPEFDGQVVSGGRYVLVDDVVSSGATVRALRQFIERNGGRVVAVAALATAPVHPEFGTAEQLAMRLDVRREVAKQFDVEKLNTLLRDYGIAEDYRELTNREGRFLLSFGSLERLRAGLAREGPEGQRCRGDAPVRGSGRARSPGHGGDEPLGKAHGPGGSSAAGAQPPADAGGDSASPAAHCRGVRGGGGLLPPSDDEPLGKARRPTPAAGQLGFAFTPRKPVQNPGSHGGHYYRTDAGDVRYGDKPTPKVVIQSKAPPGGWRESDSLRPDPTKLAAEHAAIVDAFDRQPEAGRALILAKFGLTRAQWDALSVGERATKLLRAIDEAESRRRQQVTEDAAEKRRLVAAAADAARPATAKTYADDPRAQSWEVLEHDFIAHTFEQRLRAADRNAEGWARDASERKEGTAKRRESEMHAESWRARAAKMRAEGPSPGDMQRWRDDYLQLVKKAISSGKPVPTPVIGQRPEFAKALTARQRYEKGRHTSFANESVAVDRSMQRERGYKVKRQDGKPITPAQVTELQQGIEEVETVLGPLADLFRRSDLTIAHTSGKHPFLKANAGGLYHVGDRTVSVGVVDPLGRPIAALAHELAHWLDFEAGSIVGVKRTVSRSGRKARTTTALSEHDAWTNALIQDASRSMTRTQEVRRLLATKLGEVKGEEAAQVERARVQLGPYWHEPAEIFARLVEQYVTTVRGTGGVASEDDYTGIAGYWSAQAFARLAPAVAKELGRRLEILGADPTKVTGQPSHMEDVVRQAGFASIAEAREAVVRDVAEAFDVSARRHAEAQRVVEHIGDGTPPSYIPADQHDLYRERAASRRQGAENVIAERAAHLEARDPRVPQLSPEVRAGLLNSGADHLTPLVAPEEPVAKASGVVREWFQKVMLWAKSMTTAHLPAADPAAPLAVGFFHDGEKWVHGEPSDAEKRALARRLEGVDRALRDLYREREALTQTLVHTEEEDVPAAGDEMAKAVLVGRCEDLRAEIAALTAVIEERVAA